VQICKRYSIIETKHATRIEYNAFIFQREYGKVEVRSPSQF